MLKNSSGSTDHTDVEMAEFARAAAEELVAVRALDAIENDTSSSVPALVDLHASWYERLIDELPIAVFAKDLDGRYVVVNRRFVESFPGHRDVTRHDLIGRTDFDFIPQTDAEVYQHKDQAVFAGDEIRDLEEELVRPDGISEFHRTTKLALRDPEGRVVGLLGFSAEVSEPVRVAAALAESERRYRLALRASRDGIWELDLDTMLVSLSARGARLLHLPVSNEPRVVTGLFEYEDRSEESRMRDAIGALRRDPSRMLSIRSNVVLLDGERRTLQLEAAPVVEDGNVARIIGSVADVTDDVANEDRLLHLANHDDLTSLENRRALLAAIDAMIDARVEGGTLLYLDLDDFKLVNDSLGHLAGDRMLIEVADRLRSTVTAFDVVARFGGDEFAVLLRPDGRSDRAEDVSRAIIETFSRPFVVGDVETYASASIGALSIDGYESSDDLIRDADTAMYSAKKARESIRYFEPEMHRAASTLRQLHSDLRRASEGNEYHLVYQPVVESHNHRVAYLEALLRWTPEDAVVPKSPAEFLPALEETGLIVDVGGWVIHETCRQLAEWRDVYGMHDLTASINLSRAQVDHPGLVDEIRSALRRFGLPGSKISFEITETAIAADPDRLLSVLLELRSIGALVAIDDFGVGQSCLSQLYDIPIDLLKIDMSFVRRIGNGHGHEDPVLESILAMGRALGKQTVAEGVETIEQARWLADHDCDFLQGYYFDRPLTPLQVGERTHDARFTSGGGAALYDPNSGWRPEGPPILR